MAPNIVMLDYNQEISGSFSMHATPSPIEEGWPFVCKNTTGQYNSCPDYTRMFSRRYNYFKTNQSSCLVYRSLGENFPFQVELNSLASSPMAWHGNGAGKEVFKHKAFESIKCFLQKRDMTLQDYDSTFSG